MATDFPDRSHGKPALPEVYFPDTSPRNHAGCSGSYHAAVLNGHFRSLLAQFELTPKSKRGLASSEAVDALWYVSL